ncbi:MAG: hypothetical protein MZV63_55075 [Marinilabiliales bacterium]|nr:hypothetical protein [Marinilabiliales bacterium]
MASRLGIGVSTIYRMLKEREEFPTTLPGIFSKGIEEIPDHTARYFLKMRIVSRSEQFPAFIPFSQYDSYLNILGV